MQHSDLTLKQTARYVAGATHASLPVVFVDGNAAPKVIGESWHYENASGDYIHSPSAYRAAYGNPIYCASTRRVEVGRDWRPPVMRKHDADGVCMYLIKGSREWHHGCRVDFGYFSFGEPFGDRGRPGWLVRLPDGTGYHVTKRPVYLSGAYRHISTARDAIREAIGKVREQRAKDRAWRAGLPVPLASIVCTRADSLAAGNCAPGTDSFIRRHGLNGDDTLPAPDLLAMENTQFTRRVVAAAAERLA